MHYIYAVNKPVTMIETCQKEVAVWVISEPH